MSIRQGHIHKILAYTSWLFSSFLLLSSCFSNFSQKQHILFLGWDEAEVLQLFVHEIGDETSSQLTQQPMGVIEYALSPDRSKIAYVIETAENSSEIWLLQLNGRFQPQSNQIKLTCPQARCDRLVWSPDNRRLVYEKRMFDASAIAGSPTLWWLDNQTGDSVIVLPDVIHPTMAATFSPDGTWLTYAVPSDERLYGYNFENGRYIAMPSVLGTAASWHPNSNSFIMNQLDLVIQHGGEGDDHQEHSHESSEAVHIFKVDVDDESRQALTEAANVDDGSPVYSPNGEWIVFGRKTVRTNSGRQLWIMQANGSQLRPLTNDIAIHHGAVSWSEDGRFLLYQMVDTQDFQAIPSIWMMNIETGEATKLVGAGVLPSWLTN